ncbi:hypothetical protein SCLCIDRAFT_1219241 [Scleroderma citrinum Foug A]|uniref:Uncharacterized protein n=1 Tax=Scleroderma citrinum Foug A TaxID=1036808 RepID=A0A0C3DNZ2_9AGAM|nr:hypothetical protein SCLCIDRAFT_1219241 [Scleroderma citrinum Foug A]
MSSVHRRKSSKEESDDSLVENQDVAKVFPNPSLAVPTLITPPSPSRNRVFSSPNGNLPPLGPGIPSCNKPPPAPLGACIPARRPPSVSLNTPPTSPLRTSFTAGHTRAHSRTRSISSGPFVTSSLPSPLQSSFQPLHVPLFPFPTSNTSPDGTDTSPTDARVPPPGHTRRHSRLHSRNLSIFFPRPHATISEVERPEDEEAPAPPPEHLLIPTAQSEPILAPGRGRGELDSSFTFGGIPKSESLPDGIEASGLGQGVKTRRGHHHKHSVSHNFFSFLEPGRVDVPPAVPTKPEDLRTTPTPTPLSPWTPISNASLFSSSNLSVPELIPRSSSKSPGASSSLSDPLSATGPTGPSGLDVGLSRSGGAAAVTAILQFILGAFLWARGQSIGSLACTGLGYWVVFDAVGIAGPVLISYHAHESGGGMYGPARRGTMLLFAQCVYLMFSGIYVAKEAIEHILLAAGNGAHGHGHGGPRVNEGDGHHHHWGDERPETLGLRFPVFLIFLVLLSLVGTSAVFQQHNVLANITSKRIPSPADLFRHHRHALNSIQLEPTSAVKRFIQNPYTLPPILFCVAILGVELVLDVCVAYFPFCPLVSLALSYS